MLPCKLVFRQKQPKGTYSVIFKVGNDLRQDQFAVQMISLFNSVLLANGIDLRMTNYKVLATSSKCGQF
jgi:phosphatidylinositol 3-kinase